MKNKVIGVNAVVRNIDEIMHPEAAVERYTAYISFSNEPDYSALCGGEVDDYGIPDCDIMAYMQDEDAIKDYMEYPTDGYAILDYTLVTKQDILSNPKLVKSVAV